MNPQPYSRSYGYYEGSRRTQYKLTIIMLHGNWYISSVEVTSFLNNIVEWINFLLCWFFVILILFSLSYLLFLSAFHIHICFFFIDVIDSYVAFSSHFPVMCYTSLSFHSCSHISEKWVGEGLGFWHQRFGMWVQHSISQEMSVSWRWNKHLNQ